MERIFVKPQPLELHTHQFPSELRSFNAFLGFGDIKNRIERTEQKVKSLRSVSDVLKRRYAFQMGLRTIYNRLRLSRPVDFGDVDQYRTASAIATINAIRRGLSEKAAHEFRSKILESLKPDRDFRAIEHELRTYIHLRQRGYSVQYADLEGIGDFDFLATGNGTQIEIECKSIGEDVGSVISIERSIIYYEAFRRHLSRSGGDLGSGIISLVFKKDECLIWLHFLGLNEQEFRSLTDDAQNRKASVFNAISSFVLRSPNRSHLKCIYFSADSETVERTRDLRSSTGYNLSMGGPAYFATNLKCRFPEELHL